MQQRTQKRLNIGLAVILLIFVAFVQSFDRAGTSGYEDPSLASYEDPGRRAAFLLLQQLGFRAEPWQRPPSSLPRDGATLILPDVPRSVFGRDSSSDLPDSPLTESAGHRRSLDIHLPVHYRRFLDSGGVLFASADEGMLEFFADELELEDLRDWKLIESESEETVLPTGGELAIESAWEFSHEQAGSYSVWAEGENGAPQIVSYPVGSGELVLFADGDLLSNGALRDGDEGLLFVRAIEEFDRSGRILFDEYSLGRWNPMSRSELALSDRFLQLTVQFLLLLGLFVWRLSWVGRFPRDPQPFELLSPLLRVRSQAYLLERAGRYDLLGRWLVAGVVGRAMASWRLRKHRGKEQESSAEDLVELGKRVGIDGAKWSDALCEQDLANSAELGKLEDSLLEFEREVMRTHSIRGVRGKVERAK